MLNVLTGERYKTIAKETAGILKGEYGRTPAPVNAALQARVLDGADPVTCRPADLLKPELAQLEADVRRRAQEKGITLAENAIDDVLTVALFPQPGLKFLENRHNPAAFEPVPQVEAAQPVAKAEKPAVSGVYTVEVEGKAFVVKVSDGGDVSQLTAAAPASAPAAAAPAGAGTPVTAPLAGTIWKVLASEGQTVAAGEVLLILEAMKMETEIRAAQAGTVRGIAVKAGDAVAVGDTLMTGVRKRNGNGKSERPDSGHGADAPRRRPGHHAAGQPAAALAGDCEEVRAVTAAADWLRRPALQYPGGRAGAHRPESLLAHHDPAQLAVIAAKLHCAPDVHAIKEALALALPSVQGQMESLAVDMGYSAGVLAIFYKVAIGSGIAPLVIFMGVGAMTDFGPLLANPRTLLLGAAQFGIFVTVLGALTLNYFGIISFTLPQAAAIGIIGGADGPTAIYLSGKLAPELLGAIAVAAYSYMALVPLIQPPIMKALTTDKERKIRMVQLRTVSKRRRSSSRRCCCCWWRSCCRTPRRCWGCSASAT
ncbi:hypothetical protein KPZU09_28760 [Klebsiella pneumoniae]|uniref:oxaloacetate decarboxylase (Na(+) extruding) n=3 Tax=Klebsiella pneumoniae TaxID=573 RepID=A0A919LUW7_KLEPN|nr:hypothetical protein KPZU09_28760 [Klebsiella pneumoniae]